MRYDLIYVCGGVHCGSEYMGIIVNGVNIPEVKGMLVFEGVQVTKVIYKTDTGETTVWEVSSRWKGDNMVIHSQGVVVPLSQIIHIAYNSSNYLRLSYIAVIQGSMNYIDLRVNSQPSLGIVAKALAETGYYDFG